MRKLTSRIVFILCASVLLAGLTGCRERVTQGHRGRISTSSGWDNEILKPGLHTCFGHDEMFLLDTTTRAYKETLNILIGGKVNLRVDVTVRCRVNVDDDQLLRKAFENVPADHGEISVDQLYKTFLQQKVLAIPKQIYEVQPDVQTAVANGPKLVAEARKQVMEMAKTTPLMVEDMDMINYDWPESITKAQEELVKIQLKEAEAQAQVKADLAKAEGDLKVAEADKLVEMKKAEAVAESIDIIKAKLAGAPEYLLWHQIRVMGEAAMGPNNCFILYPYNTDVSQINQILGNANLTQMVHPDGPHPELKKASATNQPPAAESAGKK